jgi:hypothetical protein
LSRLIISSYQLRLLIKTYQFVESRYLAPDLLDSSCPISSIRNHFLDKLGSFIRTAIVWLVNTDMTYNKLLLAVPSWFDASTDIRDSEGRVHRCYLHRNRLNIERSYNQACYATLGVWYAVKNCPVAVPLSVMEFSILPRLKNAFELVQHRADRNKDPTAKNDILQWLHVSCLYLLCGCTFLHDERGDDVDGFEGSGLEQAVVERLHQRFEKYVSRMKTSQSEAYTVYNEELDRLHLLAEELGIGDINVGNTSSLVRSRVTLARRSIRQRKRTTTFMPGPKLRKGPRPVSTGPWEMIATNHESYLRVADESNLTSARDRLFQFMMADYGFMASWDRADSKLIGKWWGFEPNSIICATILDLKVEGKPELLSYIIMMDVLRFHIGKLRAARAIDDPDDMAESTFDLLASPSVIERGNPLEVQPKPHSEDRDLHQVLLNWKHAQEEFGREQLLQLRNLVEQAERGTNPAVRPYDWMATRPSVAFHPVR